MNKKLRNILILGGIFIFLLGFINFFENSVNSGHVLFEKIVPERNIEFSFYDTKENCTIDGEVFVENNSLGNTKNGIFLLNESEYLTNLFGSVKISIIGQTDYCFGDDSGLPFKESWIVSDLDYYFENNESLFFEAEVNPRWPYYPEEMQGFVRPEEVSERFSKIILEKDNSKFQHIEKIFKYTYMNWASDINRFGELEYWQTPSNFIRNKGGDCEDWAIYFLSLLRKYDSDLDCYAAIWSTHVNVLCQINQTFIIFDQSQIQKNLHLKEELTIQDNKINARKWRNDYFDLYGIGPNEGVLFYLLNEEEYIEFQDGQEDFIEWLLERAEVI